MHLPITQYRLIGFRSQLHRQNRGMKRLVFQLTQNSVVIQKDLRRRLAGTVQNSRNLPRFAQAAARTSALFATRFGCDFKLSHDTSPIGWLIAPSLATKKTV